MDKDGRVRAPIGRGKSHRRMLVQSTDRPNQIRISLPGQRHVVPDRPGPLKVTMETKREW